MLAAYRRLPDLIAMTRSGGWRLVMGESRYYELAGKTIGVIGMGKIGQEVVRRLKGWSVTPIYYDVFRRSEAEEADLGITYVPLNELFARSDIITLHAPLTDDTRHIVNAERLQLVKPTLVLVNAARGELVDETALLDALNDGRVLMAALDTLAQEPPPTDHPLTHHPRAIVTPHVAGPTWDSWPRASRTPTPTWRGWSAARPPCGSFPSYRS